MVTSGDLRPWRRVRGQHGAALVEFALVALVLSLLLGATVEFGRLMFYAQALQDAARVAARELALIPLPAGSDFETALMDTSVRTRIYDPEGLVIPLASDADMDAFFANAPVVNRALRPLMIVDQPAPGGPRYLRYPGALLSDPSSSTGLTVGIPLVDARDPDTGAETIRWVGVVEEIRCDRDDPGAGPFSAVTPDSPPACLPPDSARGMVALRINYPYQAGVLTAHTVNPAEPFEPTVGRPIGADDNAVIELNPDARPGGLLEGPAGLPDYPVYSGPYGLGRQLAYGGRTVRPFRRLLSAQAIYRREVFQ